METMTLFFMAVSVGVLPFVLWWIGRVRNPPWDDWQMIFDARGHRAYRTLRERMQWDRETIDETYGQALAARYRGSTEEGERMLDLGYNFLAEVAGERRQLLGQIALYTRMIGSVLPAPPLTPARFRLGTLGTLTGLAFVAHHFLVTSRERLQLRLCILRLGFRIVLRTIFRGSRGAMNANADLAWARINAGREDFHALSEESLESLRVLLLSLAAHRESGVALQRA